MSNKQLSVLIFAIFASVLFAYQIFVGFDFRGGNQKGADALEANLNAQQQDFKEKSDAAGAALRNAGF